MIQTTDFPTLAGELSYLHLPGSLPIIVINNQWATAHIALQGGQVLHYQRHGQHPLVWHSPHVPFAVGSVPRGGVPVLFPWFGVHPSDSSAPRHGLVRLAEWRVQGVRSDVAGTVLVLRYASPALPHSFWQAPFTLTLTVQVGATLDLQLCIENNATAAFTCSGGLHTYFAVSHIANICVQGLDGVPYIGSPSGGAAHNGPQVQLGDVTFGAEVDNIYSPAPARCWLVDSGWQRRVEIAQQGATGAVVWNPGEQKSNALRDMNWQLGQQMVCVESIIAPQQPLTLAAGASHTLAVRLSTQQN